MTVTATWHGDPALREDVLAQLAAHAAATTLAPLLVRGQLLDVHGTLAPPRHDASSPSRARARWTRYAAVLGLPEDLLRVGWGLYEGLPDSPAAIGQQLELKREFLRSIPPCRDASGAVAELVAWRLEGLAVGIEPAAGVLVADVPIALRLAMSDALTELRGRLESSLAAMPLVQYPVPPAARETARTRYVLSLAHRACVPLDPEGAEAWIDSAVLPWDLLDRGESEGVLALQRALAEILAACPRCDPGPSSPASKRGRR